MLFTTASYGLFLPVVLLGFFALPHRARWAWLLGASYFFYGYWRAEYLLLLAASTLVDYVCGLLMASRPGRAQRLPYLLLSLAVNLGLLFTFKYLDLFVGTVGALAAWGGRPLDVALPGLLLPVGISFYTFQSLSYSIEVYLGHCEAERHLGYFALYVAFFPQLVAGPIERPGRLLPQLRAEHRLSDRRVSEGLRWILWGLVKKLVVADRLALYVDWAYADPSRVSGAALAVATYFFAVQIYCDFSGYCDIAVGSAKLFGVDLMQNFRGPYWASSAREFWSRWHVSLSTWFRDYVYVPLGGNRVARWRWVANILIVFVVSGLWHGANWTFVCWGAGHGLLYLASWALSPVRRVAEGDGRPLRRALVRVASVALTFHAVLGLWVLFRAASLRDAGLVYARVAAWSPFPRFGSLAGPLGVEGFALTALMVLAFAWVDWLDHRRPVPQRSAGWSGLGRWVYYYGAASALLLFGVFDASPFIYFAF